MRNGVIGFVVLMLIGSLYYPVRLFADEEEELADLLAVVNEETEIATKTRMNTDYVPGTVTVLDGEDLEALGIHTVWEALSMVPGIQPVIDPFGGASVIVRGIDFPFNSGNVKILVNSVPLTQESAGINGSALFIPVKQVDRIEVIRGPGSVLYGDFAFMGLVNIITRTQGSRFYVQADSQKNISGGGGIYWKDPQKPLEFSGSISGLHSGDAVVPIPQEANDQRGSGILTFKSGGFSFLAQALRRNLEGTGRTNPGAIPLFNDETSWSTEARYSREVSRSLHWDASLAYLNNDLQNFVVAFNGSKTGLAFDLQWDGWTRQSWLASVEYARFNIDHASQRIPPPPGQPGPPVVGLFLSNADRNVFATTVQDKIDLNPSVSLTAALRYDSYSDVDHRATPRVSLAWRASDHHIFKTQYAQGFRAPTFFELYGPGTRIDSLNFEVNSTTEFNYIYRQPEMVVRATVFHCKLSDMIYIVGPGVFANSREASSSGLELEFTRQLNSAVKLMSSVSWADTKDTRAPAFGPEDPAAANWLGDLALLVSPVRNSLIGFHWYHVGDRANAPQAGTYDLLDATFSRQNCFIPGLDIRAGVKNILNDQVRDVFPLPNALLVLSFEKDRRVWFELSWSL